LKRIGVVTSGGDAPGMNAVIRAVTRIAYSRGLTVVGFERGWEGLMKGRFRPLTPRSVGGILGLGGTILHTARSLEFMAKQGVERAAGTLASCKVDGLVVIGGDGSFRGACKLGEETDTLIVGIPASIDNDVSGTDETVGFDTAVNTVVSEIDKIRDTAVSHERIFIVEVMGKTRGFLALASGITAGAEVILVPELKTEQERIIKTIRENRAKGKRSGIVVVAEGVGDTRQLAKGIEEQTDSEVRLSILGYAQRGGSPTARSRMLACIFGNKAMELLLEKQGSLMVGLQNGTVTSIGLKETCKNVKPLDLALLRLADTLAT
jgi:6-phosphofructokinase 1